MSTNEIAGLTRAWPSNPIIVTHDGTKLGEETGEGTFTDVWIFTTMDINIFLPALDVWGQTRTYASTSH